MTRRQYEKAVIWAAAFLIVCAVLAMMGRIG